MHHLSITAIGCDHPGIVAAVTGVLLEQGCNLADCSMALLGGQFAMIILLEAPDSLDAAHLAESLETVERSLDLRVHVQPASTTAGSSAARPFVLSVYGADHPGIVYRVTAALAACGVNVTGLVSRVTGEDLYTVVLDLDFPEGLDADRLGADLRAMANDAGLDIALRPAEVDAL